MVSGWFNQFVINTFYKHIQSHDECQPQYLFERIDKDPVIEETPNKNVYTTKLY